MILPPTLIGPQLSRSGPTSAGAASAGTSGGFLIVATFAIDGPTHCSGLPVARYGPDELAAGGEAHPLARSTAQ